MKTISNQTERGSLQTGVSTFIGLVIYFMLMKWLHMEQVLELRFFNFVILTIGICYSINKGRKNSHDSEFYLEGWALGMKTAIIAILLFAFFISIYISSFDDTLLQRIKETTTLHERANAFYIFFTILMEGMASAIVITLGAMQYYKIDGRKGAPEHN